MKKVMKEFQNKSLEELQKAEGLLREEIAKLRLESGTSPLKDTNTIVKKRKRLAVILTLLTNKAGKQKL